MAAWPTARRDWLPSPGFALRTADYGSVPRDAEPHVAEARRGKPFRLKLVTALSELE
jgi:hypothetical protein